MKRPPLTLAVALALLLIGGSSCGRRESSSDSAPPARPEVTVDVVSWRQFGHGLDAPGQWKSSTELAIQAPFDAVLEALTPHPGDRVTRGETLGTWLTWESAAALQGAELLAREARDSTAAREARRALALAHAGMVHVPIQSPTAGTVTRRSAEPRSRLASGAELMALVPDDDVVFEARVSGSDARALHRGGAATIEDGVGGPMAASVVSVMPTAGVDQTTLIWLRPTSPGVRPTLGQFGHASIELGAPYRALAVPDSAVVEDDLTGHHTVALVDSSGRLAWVEVHLGRQEGRWREVSGAGLQAGRQVVVEGQWALPAGTPVRIRP
jgi:multidrug efflux pump subunit AcrA (membrane-fusion protein)